jgi:hypothetical protein
MMQTMKKIFVVSANYIMAYTLFTIGTKLKADTRTAYLRILCLFLKTSRFMYIFIPPWGPQAIYWFWTCFPTVKFKNGDVTSNVCINIVV